MTVSLSAAGCSLLQKQALEPGPDAGIDLCGALDQSTSFGLDTLGRRQAPARETFAAAKRRLGALLLEDVVRPGDRVVCVFAFSDEPVSRIQNLIPSGEILIDSTRMESVRAELNMLLDGVSLRNPLERHTTLYHNVLDRVLLRFNELGTEKDRRLLVVLSDIYGSESDSGIEIVPEAFEHAYVLVLRAMPNGELAVTPNERLRALVDREDASVAEYGEAVRRAYRQNHPVLVTRTDPARVAALSGLLIAAAVAGVWHRRRRHQRERSPRLDQVFYTPQGRAVVIMGRNIDFSERPEDYLVDGGALQVIGVQRNGGGRVQISLAEELPGGSHAVAVQTPRGPLHASFGVAERSRPPEYQLRIALLSRLGEDRSIALGAGEVELLEGFRVNTSLRARREGRHLVLRARHGRVRTEDGAELLTPRSFELEAAESRPIVLDLEEDSLELQVRRI